MESSRDIRVFGAQEHNLRGIDVRIPRERLVVVTGPSGSGKSSLAKDTLYAEGHRRYVECLSTEARQYLQQIRKPAVDRIEGLPPSIYIEQRPTTRNPRSTVGTATEIHDLLRLLFSKLGEAACPRCGEPIQAHSLEEMTDRILDLAEGTRLVVLAPLPPESARDFRSLLDRLQRQGFLRIRVDGKVTELGDPALRKGPPVRSPEVVVDRIALRPGIRSRLNDSIETAAALSGGRVNAWIAPGSAEEREQIFSEKAVCGGCGAPFPEIHPRLFSFNSPHGACPACSGLGRLRRVDEALVVPDPRRSLAEGALAPWEKRGVVHARQVLESLARFGGFDLFTPFGRLPATTRSLLLHGSGTEAVPFHFEGASGKRQTARPFEGVIPNLERRYRETDSEKIRQEIGAYMTDQACGDCGGARLRPEALAVRVNGLSIADLSASSILELARVFEGLALSAYQRTLVEQVIEEIRPRLDFLGRLGLEYLTLDREVSTLSGGEAQRIQLATHIGSGLVGVLYLLDEPTLGLHARDTRRLLDLLERLRDRGNTVLVVEHDEQTIRAADHVIDMGPGAGVEGGLVMFSGDPAGMEACADSLTGQYLQGARRIPVPDRRPTPERGFLTLKGVSCNNLRKVTARIPVGLFTCVTGVSGSGKSSLVFDALYPALAARLGVPGPAPRRGRATGGKRLPVQGLEFIDKVIPVDQAPLSRSPRSNPATYVGIFSLLRDLFAQLPESRRRGYGPARFSFNVKGGRCEVCQGAGLRKMEMHFLPDVYVTCDLCKGRRYNRETLEVRYRGRNIAEVLDMTVQEALALFEPVPQVARRLEVLAEVGLGYLGLGQPATTLSGGEAQRVKLGRELARSASGRTLYIMDEPTTGLHFADVERLLEVLQRLTDGGNTVLVIEHNLEVLKTADWIIDLGPEGGEKGGRIVVEGTPEEVAAHPSSHTGRYLRELLSTARGLRAR